jgi:nesprin-1
MLAKGELLSSVLTKEKAKGVQAKVATAKEDWKTFHSNLHQKESALEVQYGQPTTWSHSVLCCGGPG